MAMGQNLWLHFGVDQTFHKLSQARRFSNGPVWVCSSLFFLGGGHPKLAVFLLVFLLESQKKKGTLKKEKHT